MFNLGYKEVVLNSDKGVYIAGKDLVIEGYGKFKPGQLTNKKQIDSHVAEGEESSWAIKKVPDGLVVGDAVDVSIDVRTFREKSSQARDFLMHGKKIVFQSAKLNGIDADAISLAISEGFASFVARNMQSEWTFIVEDGKGSIDIKILPGFEDNYIKAVKLKRAAKCTGADNCFVDLEGTVTKEGNEGVGLGKWLEESRRFGTKENVMPYAQSHGGNSQGIDVRGSYKTYMFDFDGEDADEGWESHEYVDHSYVSAKMSSKPTHYVIYANDASSALATILDAFIA